MKRLRWAVLAAAVGSMLFAGTAHADPPNIIVDASNGRVVKRFYHPTNDGWYVDVAVATDLAYADGPGTEPGALSYVSGVSRITRGPGAVRTNVETIRVGIAARVVNDHFPSKDPFNRNNTPTNCGTATDLYGERAPQDGTCEDATQRVVNWLNSDADYVGNVVTNRGFSDWISLVAGDCVGDSTAATRGFFAVRWQDGSYTRLTLRTSNVPLDC